MRTVTSAATLALAMIAGNASAATISFDFTSLGANNTPLGHSVVVNGVAAAAFVNGAPIAPTNLWLRNQTNDHGLGVCSEGESACRSGGGDVNELSNQANPEIIRLTRPDDTTWESLWVSSLDGGGTGGSEEGWLFWSNDPGTASLFVEFSFGDFGGAVEGDILTLLSTAGFDRTAKYIFFTADWGSGDNNDYLVWKGTLETVETPEPAALGLLGLGLAGIAAGRRRRQVGCCGA
jgi:hypothetical protein